MGTPFKEWIDAACVARIAADIAAVYGAFDAAAFQQRALAGLPALELKARVAHVADALRPGLPARWEDAATVLEAALPPPLPRHHDFAECVHVWPLTELVARHGLGQPDVSLPLLREMTRRWSAEFAIRPFLVRWPGEAAQILDEWVAHPDAHVRRLVSEGTRPRLPWGLRLRAGCDDPRPGLARITRLVADPAPYVRRSVANHLGDVCKDHPALAVQTARQWVEAGHADVARHGLRTLLKAGDAEALHLMGAAAPVRIGEVRHPDTAVIGSSLRIEADVTAEADTTLRVDVVWLSPSARGWSTRVVRAPAVAARAGLTTTVHGTVSLRPVTTRRILPGVHGVHVRVNGQDSAVRWVGVQSTGMLNNDTAPPPTAPRSSVSPPSTTADAAAPTGATLSPRLDPGRTDDA